MKKQKSKYRFNLIDVVLIVLIIAVLGGIYYFVSGNDGIFSRKSDENEHKMRYVVELKTVDKDYIDNIENSLNKDVIETIRNGVIGKLVGVDVSPAWTVTTNIQTGEMKKSYYPAINRPDVIVEQEESVEDNLTEEEIGETVTDEISEEEEPIYDYYNVRLTIESDMQFTGSSYSVGGYEIVVGHPVYFRLPLFISSGYCLLLEELE